MTNFLAFNDPIRSQRTEISPLTFADEIQLAGLNREVYYHGSPHDHTGFLSIDKPDPPQSFMLDMWNRSLVRWQDAPGGLTQAAGNQFAVHAYHQIAKSEEAPHHMRALIPFGRAGWNAMEMLAEQQETFDGNQAWESYQILFPEKSQYLFERGFNPGLAKDSPNMDAFVYNTDGLIMYHQALDQIDAVNENVGLASNIGRKTYSALTNYFLHDPDMINLAPLAGAGRVAGTALQGTARGLGIGVAATTRGRQLTDLTSMRYLAHADALGRGMRTGQTTLHGALASKLGTTGAFSVEAGAQAALGVAAAARIHHDHVAFNEKMFGHTDYARDMSMMEWAAAGGLNAGFFAGMRGLFLGGGYIARGIQGYFDSTEARKAVSRSLGQGRNDVISKLDGTTPESVAVQMAEQNAAVNAIRLGKELTNNRKGHSWWLNKDVLEDAGLDIYAVEESLTILKGLKDRGVDLPPHVVERRMQELFTAGRNERLNGVELATSTPDTLRMEGQTRVAEIDADVSHSNGSTRRQAASETVGERPVYPDVLDLDEVAIRASRQTDDVRNADVAEWELRAVGETVEGGQGRWVLVAVPSELFTQSPKAQGRFIARAPDLAKVKRFQKKSADTAEPVTLGREADMGEMFVLDGKYRVVAALWRGDPTIWAYVPERTARSLNLDQTRATKPSGVARTAAPTKRVGADAIADTKLARRLNKLDTETATVTRISRELDAKYPRRKTATKEELGQHMARHTSEPEATIEGRQIEANFQAQQLETSLQDGAGIYVLVDVPIEIVDPLSRQTDPALVQEMAKRSGAGAPAGVMGRQIDSDRLVMPDGNHRVAAAVVRGDKTVPMYMPRSLADELFPPSAEVASLQRNLKNAQARAKRAREALDKDFPAPDEKAYQDALAESASDLSRMGHKQEVNEYIKLLSSERPPSDDFAEHTGNNLLTKFARRIGLRDWLFNYATDGTGARHTVKSAAATVKEVLSMFGGTQDLRIASILDPERLVNSFWNNHLNAKQLHANLLETVQNNRKWVQENGGTEGVGQMLASHRHKGTAPDDPVARQLLKEFNRYHDQVRELGIQAGMLSEDAPTNWIHGNVNPAKLRGGDGNPRAEFVDRIAEIWTERWQNSNDLLGLQMEQLGWVTAIGENADGTKLYRVNPMEGITPDAEGNLTTVTQLSRERLAEYRASLTDHVGPDGRTAIQRSANEYAMLRLKEDVVHGDPLLDKNGFSERRKASSLDHSQQRRLDQEHFFDERLAEFFDWDMKSLVEDTSLHFAQEAMNRIALNERYGTRGGSVPAWLEAAETVALREAKTGRERQALGAAFDAFREKYLWMQGALPAIAERQDLGLSVSAKLGREAVKAVFGGFIGVESVMQDGLVAVLTTAQTPAALVNNVIHAFKTILPTRLRSADIQDYLHGSMYAYRALDNVAANRFYGGDPGITTDLSAGSRLMRPWKTFINTLLGQTQPHPSQSRLTATAYRGAEAMADTTLRAGGMHAALHWNILQSMGALHRKTGRMAARLPDLINRVEQINWKQEFDNVHAAALQRGRTKSQAKTDADKYIMKLWRGVNREAGTDWSFTLALRENNLISRDGMGTLLRHAEASGALKTGILNTTLLENYAHRLPLEESRRLMQSLADFNRALTQETMRIVPEGTPWSARTTPYYRTEVGKMQAAFTNFLLHQYQAYIASANRYPGPKFMGRLSTVVAGGGMYYVLRRLMRGEELVDIMDEARNNPVSFATNFTSRFAWFGKYSVIPQFAGNTWDNSGAVISSGQSPASGAVDIMVNGVARFLTEGAEIARGERDEFTMNAQQQRLIQSLIPAANTWWADTAARLMGLVGNDMETIRRNPGSLMSESGVPNYVKYDDDTILRHLREQHKKGNFADHLKNTSLEDVLETLGDR